MSKQIELTLVSLMPTYGSDLPSTLVELASSLLAQSRHLASTLKAEEEVARLFACAHIACDRLKITLDLPPIEPRPPIPPRVYKRLYTHLDNTLPNASANGRRIRTPSSKMRDVGSPSSQTRTLPSRATPSKDRSLAQFRKKSNSIAATPKESNGQSHASVRDSDLYPWVQPVIRHLCAGSGHKKLAPSMLAGMESILTPGGRKTDDEWAPKNATALCAAIVFFVAMRVKDVTPEEAVHREVYVPTRKEIIEQLDQARKEVTVKDMEETLWEGWTDLKPKDFDAAVAKVNENGWLNADWYRGITDVVHLDRQQDVDMLDAEDDMDPAPQVQGQRADTMLQQKFDFLSEAQRAEYKTWKEATLKRITEMATALEASGGGSGSRSGSRSGSGSDTQ